ncbi:GDSL esterase/lipase At5g45950-like isoform X1 [Triticum dicoccoides]|uniref:GDSL esterase/lipase At5g45950-like isoform X1 n=1 Tax=Triticum dicoccoides TaxID=85692 RepID=UPI001890D22A|nr:GDSL esterase/lipase At5g45950-like isoform X1 [Triticum dicoccoides]
MRGFPLAGVLVALLLAAGELHCAATAAPAPPAKASAPPPQHPGAPPQHAPPSPPRRHRSSHGRAPPVPRKQDPPSSPPPPPPKQDPPPPSPPQQQQDPPSPPPQQIIPPIQVVPPIQDPDAAAPAQPPRGGNRSAVCTTLLVFGDSTVDPGNNNRLRTTAKANFPPYGINFYGRRPTGRFTNGRLATDMLGNSYIFLPLSPFAAVVSGYLTWQSCGGCAADKLGIMRTIPGFLDPTLKLGQLRKGVSFASAGSGYDDITANTLSALPFRRQLWHFWRYKQLIRALLGLRRAERIVNRATFIISAGTNDMLLNYIASNRSAGPIAMLRYENHLIARLGNYTQVMRMLGARRFVFVGLPPIGCLPIARTLLGRDPDGCDSDLNQLAASFNSRLVQLSNFVNYQPRMKSAYIDTYTIIRAATDNPQNYGLTEVSRGCCGSGMIEVGQTCRGRRTCPDPSKYLYWDAVHPTETTNQLITSLMLDSIAGIYS